jgi:hypothetical protein
MNPAGAVGVGGSPGPRRRRERFTGPLVCPCCGGHPAVGRPAGQSDAAGDRRVPQASRIRRRGAAPHLSRWEADDFPPGSRPGGVWDHSRFRTLARRPGTTTWPLTGDDIDSVTCGPRARGLRVRFLLLCEVSAYTGGYHALPIRARRGQDGPSHGAGLCRALTGRTGAAEQTSMIVLAARRGSMSR